MTGFLVLALALLIAGTEIVKAHERRVRDRILRRKYYGNNRPDRPE